MWPFGYIQHKQACKRKQEERSSKIATLPKPYLLPLSPEDRDVLSAPIDKLVEGVQTSVKSPIDILRAYGKAAVKAQNATNCVTEIFLPEAETWIQDGSINLKGPLAGIPVSLKDSIIVGGFDATVGYSRKAGKPHLKDGAMVRMLKDMGAVPFVKTALPITLLSFESTNDVWGRCTNPHNKDYSPGGSTGGEGALLAYGGSRIGVGSDVAGSVRAPAHFSGCYSLRCSTGRWPKSGVDTSMPGQEGIPSVFSPMARTLPDLTYFTRQLIAFGPWKYDQSVHPIPWRSDIYDATKDQKSLKIGVLRTDGVVDPSPACARALDTVVEALRASGHDVSDVAPPPAPHSPLDALEVAAQLLLADGTETFTSFFSAGETNDAGAAQLCLWMRLPSPLRRLYVLYTRHVRRDPLWARLLSALAPKSAAQNWGLVRRREAIRAAWFDWWDAAGCDVLVAPPNATPAVPHGGMRAAVASCGYTFLFNLLDYTAGVLPVLKVDAEADALAAGDAAKRDANGVSRRAYGLYDAREMEGLPVGVQVVGRRLEEEKVLAAMERVWGALRDAGSVYELLEVE